MALLFMDSFDHYATADITEKWTAVEAAGQWTIAAAAGRRGSSALRVTSASWWIQKALPAGATTVVVGVAYKPPSLSTNLVLELSEATAAHVGLRVNTDGSVSVHRMLSGPFSTSNDVTLGTSAPGLVTAGVFTYIEIKATIHDTTGSVEVRLNGSTTPIINVTGVDTRNGGTGVVTLVYFTSYSGPSGNYDFDDLYLLDGTGSAPWNTFLGDCRVDARYPTAAGATTGWTPSAGSNWQNVDDAPPNDDTDYNSTSTLNALDTFVVQDAPVVGATIFGVQHCLNLKKMDAGTCTVAPVVRHAGVDNVGADISPGTSYAFGLLVQQTNPGTGAQWTEAGFNAAEFGYKKTA